MDNLYATSCCEEKVPTAKEKLQETLDAINEYQENISFIDIIQIHMNRNPKEFHAAELARIIRTLEMDLYVKVCRLMGIAETAEENATYLKKYLEGKMFTSEEAARNALPMQVKSTERILNECKKRWM